MTGNLNTSPLSVFNMTLSGNGPLVVPYVCDMRTVAEIDADLSALVANGNIDFISGAFIDNHASVELLTIRAAGSNQAIRVPAGFQAYMPILAPNEPKFIISAAGVPGVIIPIFFYNIPLLPYMWDAT